MKLKSFTEMLAMGPDQINAELAGPRAATAKARSTLLLAELNEKIVKKQQQVTEACCNKDINFERVADLLDELELLEMRTDRIQNIIDQLFPPVEALPTP